jgi:hypothetical protein
MAGILIDTAFNAFYDGLTRIEKGTGLVTPTVAQTKFFRGALSRNGANADFTGNADFSGTATHFSFLTTVACTIHKLQFSITVSDVDETIAQDANLWMGGTAALTNGFIWGVGTSGTVTPATCYGAAAKTIEQFATIWGATYSRAPGIYLNATNATNSDNLVVTLNFKEVYGTPLLLAAGVYVGIFLNDNLSAATVCTTLTGAVFGQKV